MKWSGHAITQYRFLYVSETEKTFLPVRKKNKVFTTFESTSCAERFCVCIFLVDKNYNRITKRRGQLLNTTLVIFFKIKYLCTKNILKIILFCITRKHTNIQKVQPWQQRFFRLDFLSIIHDHAQPK